MMKNCCLLLTVMFLAVSDGFTQTDSIEKKNLFVIKTDILLPSILLIQHNKLFALTFEFGFKTRHSIQLTGLHGIVKNDGSYNKYYKQYLIQDYKFFLKKEKSYTGFYVGAYCDQIFEHVISDNDPNYQIEYKTTSIGGGALIGYQNYFRKRISFDFLFGFGKSYVIDKQIIRLLGVNSVLIFDSWPDLLLAFNIGYRF